MSLKITALSALVTCLTCLLQELPLCVLGSCTLLRSSKKCMLGAPKSARRNEYVPACWLHQVLCGVLEALECAEETCQGR